jgi:hypothetical protein
MAANTDPHNASHFDSPYQTKKPDLVSPSGYNYDPHRENNDTQALLNIASQVAAKLSPTTTVQAVSGFLGGVVVMIQQRGDDPAAGPGSLNGIYSAIQNVILQKVSNATVELLDIRRIGDWGSPPSNFVSGMGAPEPTCPAGSIGWLRQSLSTQG